MNDVKDAQTSAYAKPQYPPPDQPVLQVPPYPPQRKSRGWIVGIAVVAALCIIAVVSIGSCSSVATSAINSISFANTANSSIPSSGEPKVAVIDIDGTIQYDGTSCSPSGLRSLLGKAESNETVKAVVLRVNSGGGVATAGEEMSEYVSSFSKPVVVSCASIDASAAYEISSQADFIYASKTSAIGAIGVAMQVTDLSGLYDKLGIRIENITSSESKDSSYGTRELTEDERAWYQHVVDQTNQDFIETVAAGRGMSASDVQKLANGMTYTGIDAVENNLADEIGYLENAIAKASELAGYDAPLSAYPLDVPAKSNILSALGVLGQDGGSADEAAASALEERYGNYARAE